MYDWDRPIRYETKTLERITFELEHAISKSLLEELAIPAKIEFFEDYITDVIRVQIRQEVLSEHLDRTVTTYPCTWREAVKDALYNWFGTDMTGHWPWFGDYARQRWPVKYRIVTVDAHALYPKMNAPRHEARLTFFRQER